MIEVSRFVTCEAVSGELPRTLYRVRRAWRTGPLQMGVNIEFHRNDEQQDFYWVLRVFRGSIQIFESVEQLELPGERYVDAAFNFAFRGA